MASVPVNQKITFRYSLRTAPQKQTCSIPAFALHLQHFCSSLRHLINKKI
jgi:hypothetical protein